MKNDLGVVRQERRHYKHGTATGSIACNRNADNGNNGGVGGENQPTKRSICVNMATQKATNQENKIKELDMQALEAQIMELINQTIHHHVKTQNKTNNEEEFEANLKEIEPSGEGTTQIANILGDANLQEVNPVTMKRPSVSAQDPKEEEEKSLGWKMETALRLATTHEGTKRQAREDIVARQFASAS